LHVEKVIPFECLSSSPFIIPLDDPWNPGTIAFIFDQQVPDCPRELHFQHDIDRITKTIIKGANGYQKREEIEQWVIANSRTSRGFALGERITLWWMVEMRIQIFRNVA
jgi:hypothetical protein